MADYLAFKTRNWKLENRHRTAFRAKAPSRARALANPALKTRKGRQCPQAPRDNRRTY